MLIGPDYLLKKPERPSVPKVFFDTQVVPIAANLAGGCEVALDRTARRLRVRPMVIVAGALGLAGMSLAGLSTLRRQRRRTNLSNRRTTITSRD